MAYAVFIATVDENEYQDYLRAFRNRSLMDKLLHETPELSCYSRFHSTSFLTGIKGYNPEFNDSVRELLFDGEIIDNYFWHPFSKPKYHSPEKTKALFSAIHANYEMLVSTPPVDDYYDYFETELKRILDGLRYAVSNERALIVMYEPPHDHERASRTKYVKLKSVPFGHCS